MSPILAPFNRTRSTMHSSMPIETRALGKPIMRNHWSIQH
jgi:hypothetical protein